FTSQNMTWDKGTVPFVPHSAYYSINIPQKLRIANGKSILKPTKTHETQWVFWVILENPTKAKKT
ncbi:MAG: hypothetical protein IIY02_02555, partial [Firmicutes bacterium]|nr:hypothetical protein [Bacillota bacterium]